MTPVRAMVTYPPGLLPTHARLREYVLLSFFVWFQLIGVLVRSLACPPMQSQYRRLLQ